MTWRSYSVAPMMDWSDVAIRADTSVTYLLKNRM
jgi:hypothetical protein